MTDILLHPIILIVIFKHPKEKSIHLRLKHSTKWV